MATTRLTRIIVSAVSAAGLAIAAGVTPAAAYPPGQDITIALSSTQVARATAITAQVTNAKPGIVTVKFGAVTKRTVANAAGTTHNVRWAPATNGIYLTRAIGRDGETAAVTRLYVPRATAPATIVAGAAGRMTVRYAKPGSVVQLRVDGVLFDTAVVSATSTASIAFAVDNVGSNTLSVTVGTVTLPNITVTGR
jgi:hypothetical protein